MFISNLTVGLYTNIDIKIQYNYDTFYDNTRVPHYYWQLLNAHGINEFLYLFVLVIGIDNPSAVLKVYGTFLGLGSRSWSL